MTEEIPPTTEKSAKNQRKPRSRGRPFEKGKSGNPKGKPPGTISITSAIKAKLNELYPHKEATVIKDGETPLTQQEINKLKRTYLEKIVDTIFENAIVQKDARTLKDIWNYIDGFPKATIDIGADKESLAELTKLFRDAAHPKKTEAR